MSAPIVRPVLWELRRQRQGHFWRWIVRRELPSGFEYLRDSRGGVRLFIDEDHAAQSRDSANRLKPSALRVVEFVVGTSRCRVWLSGTDALRIDVLVCRIGTVSSWRAIYLAANGEPMSVGAALAYDVAVRAIETQKAPA